MELLKQLNATTIAFSVTKGRYLTMDSNQNNQKQQIVNSLKLATAIFAKCHILYRILGSVLVVAHTQKVFRKIGDVDILLDEKSRECVFRALEENGFVIRKRRAWGFSWFEAEKPQFLGLTFLLTGEFTQHYFSWSFFKVGEARIDLNYLKPTPYNFGGVEFIGIPLSSVVTGIKKSSFNPKRKLDKEVLGADYAQQKVDISKHINVYIFGIKIPYLYDIASFMYNLYGGMRVIFKKKYEVWG